MQTILDILKKAGGWHPGLYLKIDNPPYMELVIEATDESGPCGLPAISVAHYGKQNGDAMRDPEMCFELSRGAHLTPFYWRNDYAGVEQWSRFIEGENYCYHTELHSSTSSSPRCGTATFERRALPRHSTRRSTDAANPFPAHGAETQGRSATLTATHAHRRAPCRTAANSSTSPSTPSTNQPPTPAARSMNASLASWPRSIRTNGLIQPITVRPNASGFEIVAGARRFRAAQLAELFSLPARIVDINDAQALEWQLVENSQRVDVHPYEEAQGFQRLLDMPGYDVATLVEKSGKSAAHVYARLSLLQLVPSIAEAFWPSASPLRMPTC